MGAQLNYDPAVRGRDYSVDFRLLNEAELRERHRSRAEDRAIEETKPTGKAFTVSERYNESERIRLGDGLTWADSVKFSAGGFLLLLAPFIWAAGLLAIFRFWFSIFR
jgi:hypothetical protein